MMKNNRYINIIFLILSFSLVGCNDEDFLEENPPTIYTVDNAFFTSPHIDQVLIYIYSDMRELWDKPTEQQWIYDSRGKGTEMYDAAIIPRGSTFSAYGRIQPDHNTFYRVY